MPLCQLFGMKSDQFALSEASGLHVGQGKFPAIYTKIQVDAHSSTAVRTYQLQHDFYYTHFRENTSRKYSFNRFPIEDLL